LTKFVPRDFKTILNKYKFIDSWFWCRYSVNPYNGCQFACTYCDSRSHKYHLHPEFDQIVYVKTNVGTMLDNRLSRARTLLPDVVAIGGTCDSYQPAEEEHLNTRQCLEVLLKHHYPVCISTKSDLVLRDVDLLRAIAEDSWCSVGLTVTTLDEDLAGFLEPGAPSPLARMRVIERIKAETRSIQVGVNLIPIVPFLGDSEDNLRQVVSKAREAGADFILFGGGMTMRDNQARWFLNRLGSRAPELVQDYLDLYEASFDVETGYSGKYGPRVSYQKHINRMMLDLCEEFGMAFRIKRYIPNDCREMNYRVAERILNESYAKQIRGKAWSNLFWAGQNINNLKESINDVADRGELQSIRNVNAEVESQMLSLIDEMRSSAA
jgi:DNA repair photolyase